MKLSFSDYFGMYLRRSPIGELRKAAQVCEDAGLSVSIRDLESHHLAGGRALVLAQALVQAKAERIETNFNELAAVSLTKHDLGKVIAECRRARTLEFSEFSPKRPDPIEGFTKDGRRVRASIVVTYRALPTHVAFGSNLTTVQERLGAAVSVFINTAHSHVGLEASREGQELELKSIAVDMLRGTSAVQIRYVP